MANSRMELTWVNIIKALCMFVVFLNHSEIYYGSTIPYIESIYRPVFVNTFFLISGYLLFRKQWSDSFIVKPYKEWIYCKGGGNSLIRNVLFKLIIPTLLFSLLFYFPKIVLRGIRFDWTDFLNNTIGGGSIWFTPALAVAELLIILMLALRCQKTIHYLLYGGILWLCSELIRQSGFVFSTNSSAVPWYYKSGMEAVFMLIMGGLYFKNEDIIEKVFKNRIWLVVLVFAYVCICVCFGSYLRTALDWQGLNLYGLCVSLLGFVAIVEFAKLIPTNFFLNYAGRHSIGFYFFSGSIVNFIAVIAKHICDYNHWIIVLAIAILSYLMSFLCVQVINRWFPFMYDLRKLKK